MQLVQLLVLIALFSLAIAQRPLAVISRNYYVGGSFNNVRQYNLTTDTSYNLPAKNLASFNGGDGLWSAVAGSGTDGTIETIHVDACYNIYIGGSFTKVGETVTGPAAKYDIVKKVWSAVHTEGVNLPTYSVSSVVHSITVDCANKPTGTSCPCDVYLGGKFSAEFSNTAGPNQKAVNIIKFDHNNNEYEALGGPNHGLDKYRSGSLGASVYSIYKKGFGVFQTPLRYVWVAGNFNNSFNRWDRTDKKWGFTNPETAAGFDSNAVIYDMHYKTGVLFDTDVIYLGGSYTHSTCKNICEFDYKKETFSKVASTEVSSTVNQVDYVTITDTLVIGTSTESDSLKRIRAVQKPSTTSTWSNYGKKFDGLIKPVRSLSTCGSGLCNVGSYAYIAYNSKDTVPSSDEIIRFYSAELQQEQTFGGNPPMDNGGTDGQARVIVPIIAAANSVIISFASIFMMVIFALIY